MRRLHVDVSSNRLLGSILQYKTVFASPYCTPTITKNNTAHTLPHSSACGQVAACALPAPPLPSLLVLQQAVDSLEVAGLLVPPKATPLPSTHADFMISVQSTANLMAMEAPPPPTKAPAIGGLSGPSARVLGPGPRLAELESHVQLLLSCVWQ